MYQSRMRYGISAAVMGLVCYAGVAQAQVLGPETAEELSALGETSPMRLGITLSPMPAGSLKTKLGSGPEDSDSTAFAFGIAPTFDYSFNQFFFVGLAPQFIFNVKSSEADDANDDSATELDLRIRVGGNAKVADAIMLYGYLAPGYSIVMLPDAAKMSGLENPAGFVLGFAAGAMYNLTPGMFLNAELGYQLGYQKTELGMPFPAAVRGMDADLKTNFLHVGVGLGFRI